ncbi:nuclear transport factor 2 family protein [Streptomyces sp. 7R007]
MQLTSAQAFHHRWCAALAAQDTAALGELYHPDAVQLSVSTGRTLLGAEAIATGYAESFGIAGAVNTTGVENFIDLGTSFVAESTQSTSFAQATSYDVFALDGGRARFHASGSLFPRSPGALPAQDPAAPGQAFFRQLWNAISMQDAATLTSLYAPDAVHASVAGIMRGGQVITDSLRQRWRQVGPPQLRSLSCFVEGPGALAVEGMANLGFGPDVRLDVEFYEVWLLHQGRAVFVTSGLISPRPAELRQGLQNYADNQIRNIQIVAQGLAHLHAPRYWY